MRNSNSTLFHLLLDWRAKIQMWAGSGKLTVAATEALMLSGKPQAQIRLKKITDAWASGDFSSIPAVKTLSSEDMNGAMGAYAISTGNIYLNTDWLAKASRENASAVLTEELGHHLDALLNARDTPGDEGEYFSSLLRSRSESASPTIPHNEYDAGSITVNGYSVSAEYATGKWISYLGDARNDYRGGSVGHFSNGDVATAITATNSDGSRQICISRISASGSTIWSQWITADYGPWAGDIEIDSADNIVISGSTKIGASGRSGKNDSDIFAAKLNANGSLLWYKNYGTNIHEIGATLELDLSGGIIISGRVSEANDALQLIQDVTNWYGTDFSSGWKGFQMRISSADGSLLKAYTTGSYNSSGDIIKLDKSRNRCYITGYTFGAVNGVSTIGNGDSSGANDYLIARNETTGSPLWTLMRNDITSTIAIDENSDSLYIVNKGSLEKINGTTSTTVWTRSILPAGIFAYLAMGADGVLYGAWNTTPQNVAISRFRDDGTSEWTINATSTSDISAVISVDKNGLLYVHGNSSGNVSVDGSLVSTISRPGGQDAFILAVPTLTTVIPNQTPANLTISTNNFNENLPAGSTVAILNTIDLDTSDTFTYSLVSGAGSDNNSDFTIVNNQLRINTSPNFESRPNYNIRIRTTDAGGLFLEQSIQLTVNNVAETIRGNSYYAITLGPSWSNAQANAASLGGHLTTINDSLENNFLKTTFNTQDNGQGLWIGLTDATTEGTWIWSSGSTSTFRNWFADQPDNSIYFSALGQDYAYIHTASTGNWDDSTNVERAISGIAEVPITSSIVFSSTPKEGQALTTTINLNAGTTTTGNLVNGAMVYWTVTGVTAEDLTSGALTGNGVVTNGKLTLQHALKIDADTGEQFQVSAYSDAAMTQKIGTTRSSAIQESDITPPTLNRVFVQGTAITLQFSEAVTALSVPTTAFKVESIDPAGLVTLRTVSAVALDQNNSTKVILSLAGTAPLSSHNLRLTYTDPLNNQSSGVIQDVSGNDLLTITNRYADTFLTGDNAVLGSQYSRLTLTGTLAINGTGNGLANTIVGNGANNVIVGDLNADVLTGAAGVDTFRLALADSRLSAMDRITDLAIGTDIIDGPSACSAANLIEFGSVASLSSTDIATVLNSSVFLANRAATFTYGSGTSQQTYLALNNGIAGFIGTEDAIVNITGYQGLLTNLAIV